LSIEKFFTIIKDGTWHQINELTDQLEISTKKLTELSQLLSDHGIIKYEQDTNRIKIDPEWKLLLPIEEELSEPNITVATLIIPPDASVNVQSTQIRNLTTMELELTLRMNTKIREVSIRI